jgi:hypothetical protein
MTKKLRSSPTIRTPAGYERRSQTPLPHALRLLGWQRTPEGHAERYDASGRITAFVDTEIIRVAADDRIIAWLGYSLIPRRETREFFLTAVDAIWAVERSEALGPLDDCWEGQIGTPQYDDWTHGIQQKRNFWFSYTADGVVMLVGQGPFEPSIVLQDLHYIVSIGGQVILGPDGKRRRYAASRLAIDSAERNALRRGHPLIR